MELNNIQDSGSTAQALNEEEEDKRIELAQKEFAQEAKRLRDRVGFSQDLLAEKMDIHQNTISRIEKANYGITLDIVMKYATFFHEDPHRLADIYWGINTRQLADLNKAVLDNIWEILSNHYQPGQIHHPPPYNPIATEPHHEKEREEADQRADAVAQKRKKAEEKAQARAKAKETKINKHPPESENK